jgi:O-antigen ligase
VQNLYVQTLADLGVVGLALLLALFGAAIWLAVRARNGAGIVAASWVVLLLGLWLAQGLVAGVPLDALTWLAFGLVGIARA